MFLLFVLQIFGIKYVYEYEKLKKKKGLEELVEKKKKKRAIYKFGNSNNKYIIENLGGNLIMINKIKY